MITGFRHRGLQRLFDHADRSGVRQDQVVRLKRVLAILDVATRIEDVNQLPGMRLHPLKGDLAGIWSVSISGNWRVIFRFADGEVWDVDLVDYH
jgi:proteic killer suppression protein